MPRRPVLRGALATCALVFLWGCGSGDAPAGSIIKITPDSIKVEYEGDVLVWHTHYFTISVTDPDGAPLVNIELTISSDWAAPEECAVVQLYDGSTPVDSPFIAETDDFGVYYLRFDYLTGGELEYKGDVEVRSGSAYGKASFEVKKKGEAEGEA